MTVRTGERADVVAELERIAGLMRADLGDATTGEPGNCHPIGRVDAPRPMTVFDPANPYYLAEYDLDQRG